MRIDDFVSTSLSSKIGVRHGSRVQKLFQRPFVRYGLQLRPFSLANMHICRMIVRVLGIPRLFGAPIDNGMAKSDAVLGLSKRHGGENQKSVLLTCGGYVDFFSLYHDE